MTKAASFDGTAGHYTFLRALSSLEPDPMVRNPDVLAKEFLDGAARSALPYWEMLRARSEKLAPGAYAYALARTVHFDRCVDDSIRHGIRQIVMLGSGDDSRAYRIDRVNDALKFFEVDLPVVQQAKRRKVEAAKLTSPHEVIYVPMDLETANLADVLEEAGFDRAAPALLLWEGLSFYLSRQTFENVLSWLARTASAGSELAFDYALESLVVGNDQSFGAAEAIAWANAIGSPFRFGASPEWLRTTCAGYALRIYSDLGPDEIAAAYLSRADGSRVGRPFGCFRFARVRSPSEVGA